MNRLHRLFCAALMILFGAALGNAQQPPPASPAGGDFSTEAWKEKYRLYREKWPD